MDIINGQVFLGDRKFHNANVRISDGIISEIFYDARNNAYLDASDCYIIPGLIDTHLHGAAGYDFSDADSESIRKIASYELNHGITSFCPATMTLPEEELLSIAKCAAKYNKNQNENLSEFLGFYMEGPFFNKEKCGAQRTDCLKEPDCQLLDSLMTRSDNLIKIWALAPELSGSFDFIKYVMKKYPELHISLGHTCADPSIVREALSLGASRLTHYYNAMKNYAEIGNELCQNIPNNFYAELICDGIHNDNSRIIRAFSSFGYEHIILISDSMRATGLSDGTYTLGGQQVSVKGRLATIQNGAKAGSVTNLFDCFKHTVNIGVALEHAITACTENPAKSINIFDKVGSIESGKQADLLIVDKTLNIKFIIKNGRRI